MCLGSRYSLFPCGRCIPIHNANNGLPRILRSYLHPRVTFTPGQPVWTSSYETSHFAMSIFSPATSRRIRKSHHLRCMIWHIVDRSSWDQNMSMSQLRDELMTTRGYRIQFGHDKARSIGHQSKTFFSSCTVWVVTGMHSGYLPCGRVMRIHLHQDSVFYNCFTLLYLKNWCWADQGRGHNGSNSCVPPWWLCKKQTSICSAPPFADRLYKWYDVHFPRSRNNSCSPNWRDDSTARFIFRL